MKAHPIHLSALKAHEQALKLVDPGKGSLADKALLVHGLVEMTLPPTFHALTIALIFRNIGLHSSVPQELACRFGVKTTVTIKKCVCIIQSKRIELAKNALQPVDELVVVVMIASDDLACCQDKAIGVGQRKDVAGFGFLSPLIGDFFAPFFAALWLPSKLRIDKLSSYFILSTPA